MSRLPAVVQLKLPFVVAGGDPQQRYFSEGLTGEIVTGLSRYGELAVLPCRTGPCEGEGADPREIGGLVRFAHADPQRPLNSARRLPT